MVMHPLSHTFRAVRTRWSTLRRSTSSIWLPWRAASPSSSSSAWSSAAASAARCARSTTSRRERAATDARMRTDVRRPEQGGSAEFCPGNWSIFWLKMNDMSNVSISVTRRGRRHLAPEIWMYQRMWISLCTYVSHISYSNSPRILKKCEAKIYL